MSIIQQHTSASLSDAWRTINIDALQEDSSVNFDTSTLHPPLPEIGEAEVRALAGQVRQLLRGGDAEGALRGCLEMPVYNGNDLAKVRECPEDPAWFLPFSPNIWSEWAPWEKRRATGPEGNTRSVGTAAVGIGRQVVMLLTRDNP